MVDIMYRKNLFIFKTNTIALHALVFSGPNIFLSEKGIKLGDFGCAVKLKNHTTMPGELKSMAGRRVYEKYYLRDNKIFRKCLTHIKHIAI